MKTIRNSIKNIFSKKENIYNLFLFISLTIICYFFPYTHDDWAWGTSIGIERLTSLFKDYNGRWAGNLLVMLLTRNRLIKALIISTTLCAIIILIKKLVNSKTNNTNIIIALFLSIPIAVLSQGIAWASGFANYVPPIAIVLLYIVLNKNIFNDKIVTIKNILIIPLFLLGFTASLFVEHMTIYNVIISISITIFLIKKKKCNDNKANIAYTIGSLCGAILMFSNGAYHNIANASDNYRTIEQGNIIIKSIKVYFNELSNLLINSNTVLNIVLCIILLVLINKCIKKNKKHQKYQLNLLKICGFILCGFLCYTVYTKTMNGSNIFIYESYKKVFEGLMVGAFYLSILVTTVICIDEKEKKLKIIFELASIILISAPLLIVTPIGPRCFVPTYIFFVIIACEYIDYIMPKFHIKADNILKLLCIFLFICNAAIYGYSFKIESERTSYIEKHLEDKSLTLPYITHTNYMWYPNPANETFLTRFKLFYGIEENVEVNFISYKEWIKITSSK